MFYEIEVRSHVRVSPSDFTEDTKKAVLKRVNEQFSNFISKNLGIVVGVTEILSIGDGVIIPGDGAAYYNTNYTILAFKPEMQEVIQGNITEIADFGAFINLGPLDGMIHISQTMDDYVSFSKAGVLTGKETKRVLKAGDKCRARIVAVSYKDPQNPKIGLTMRQAWLGNNLWIEEELKKQKQAAKKEKKTEKKK
ncbi:MAG: DNA-directed RNA polymerase [Candidatus Woesearchaeota archaeon]